MNTRIYLVSQDVGNKYLVDAATPAQALRHVAAGMFDVKVATPHDVARLVADGVAVESAGEQEAA
jgi:hypothetical protein